MLKLHLKWNFRQQHLKSKFGDGVEVEIQIGNGCSEAIEATAIEKIPGLRLKDKFQGAMKFLANRDTGLATIFEKLEEIKSEMDIGNGFNNI